METNIVGINTEITDQNLLNKTALPKNISVIIDRAFSGPSNTLYLARDFKIASALYGERSPIIQLAKDVLAGSGENATIALYRIGGSAGILKNIFGEYTEIRTVAETIGAGQDLAVYVGPRPNEAGKYCVIITRISTGKIVFSNVPGSQINTREAVVEGFDENYIPYRVGSITAPVALPQVAANLLNSITEVFTATNGTTSTFTLAAPVTNVTSNLVVSKTVGTITTLLTVTKTVAASNLTGFTLAAPLDIGDVLSWTYTTPLDAQDLIDSGIEFEVGKNSLNVGLNGLYELYDTAFEDLENVRATTVTIRDLFNCRNIAAGDDGSADRLTYVKRTESDEGYAYEWSDVKFLYAPAIPGPLTTDPLQAQIDDNGRPIVEEAYNEVDFAHRLASWAHSNSTTSDYVHATIGVVVPKSTTTLAVKRWLGSLPVRDIYNTIVEDGTGLLGNRFMAGTTARVGGFYATDTGYPDGRILTDSIGAVIDLGKYLSIATLPCYLATDLISGRTTPLSAPRSFSGSYAGLITQVTPGDSTTNQAFNQVVPLFNVKDSVANKLSTLGYVVLTQKQKGTTVYSGDLATSDASDFDYISTALAISEVLKRLEAVIEPYLGRGLDLPLAAALNNSVDSELRSTASLGIINGYDFVINRVGANNLAINLKITPKEELRAVSVTLALSPDTTFNLEG